MEGYICCNLLSVFANIWHNSEFFSHILSTVFSIYHLFLPCLSAVCTMCGFSWGILTLATYSTLYRFNKASSWVSMCENTRFERVATYGTMLLEFPISYKWFYGFRWTPYLNNHKVSHLFWNGGSTLSLLHFVLPMTA